MRGKKEREEGQTRQKINIEGARLDIKREEVGDQDHTHTHTHTYGERSMAVWGFWGQKDRYQEDHNEYFIIFSTTRDCGIDF